MPKSESDVATTLADDLRRLSQRAWGANHIQLAIELEATAFRCFGINIDAERRAHLERIKRSTTAGAVPGHVVGDLEER